MWERRLGSVQNRWKPQRIQARTAPQICCHLYDHYGKYNGKKDPQDEIGADMVQIGDKPPLDPINDICVRI